MNRFTKEEIEEIDCRVVCIPEEEHQLWEQFKRFKVECQDEYDFRILQDSWSDRHISDGVFLEQVFRPLLNPELDLSLHQGKMDYIDIRKAELPIIDTKLGNYKLRTHSPFSCSEEIDEIKTGFTADLVVRTENNPFLHPEGSLSEKENNCIYYVIVCGCGDKSQEIIIGSDYIVEIGGQEWIDNSESDLRSIIENREQGIVGFVRNRLDYYEEFSQYHSPIQAFERALYSKSSGDRLLLMHKKKFYRWFVNRGLGHQPNHKDYEKLCDEVDQLFQEGNISFLDLIYVLNCSRANGDNGNRFCL